jgi:predicted nucleotidyltransferase
MKLIENKLDDLKKICSSLGVKRLYVFGSAVSNRFKENSDIDVLIAFDENLPIEQYTQNYFELHYKLGELFKRPIDLITERTLSNPYFIESIDETKKLIYEA